MKATFFALTALTAFAVAIPSAMGMDKDMKAEDLLPEGLTPEDLASKDFEEIADKKGVNLMRRQDGCKRCIDNCASIGGLGESLQGCHLRHRGMFEQEIGG